MVCYGVENAKAVWISPPKRELSATLARCIEVEPEGKTNYTLTAEGADGTSATQDLALSSVPPRVHIVNVDVSAVKVAPGDRVSICYKVENAVKVTISPTKYQGGSAHLACTTDVPLRDTTYVLTATGAGGDTDVEKVAIQVKRDR
jgi:hypothetical protein